MEEYSGAYQHRPDFLIRFGHQNRSDCLIQFLDSRSGRPPPTLPQEFHVTFKFVCNYVSSHYVRPSVDSPSIRVDSYPSRREVIVPIFLRELIICEHGTDVIREALKDWPMDESARDELIRFALWEARLSVMAMPARHTALYVDMGINVTHRFGQHEGDDDVVDDGFEDRSMVPCDESAIETVARKKIVILMDSETCCVCLDEFSKGSEAVSVPCGHVFHHDCIVQWLRTSHYCPICRFEMQPRRSLI